MVATMRFMTALARRLDHVLNTAVAEQRVVGAIAYVMQDHVVVYRRAIGLADREAGVAMTEATPHRLASLTKPITAVATLALIERGTLGLDQPVTRWLPDFRPRLADGAAPPITIRHLLTHTSGLGYTFLELPGGPYHRAHVSDGLDQPGLSLAENLRRLASVPLRCVPGTEWNYSLSYDVLGAILECADDAPLSAVFERHVTGPLGLADLSFVPRAALAVPYRDGTPPRRIREGEPVPFLPPFEVAFAPSRALDPRSYPSGGAGLVGTAADYVYFLDALRTRSIPTVSRAALDQMLRDQIAPLTSGLLGEHGFGFGVSVIRTSTSSPLRPGAVRWGGAYGHSWFIDGDTSCVLLTNTAFEGMTGRLRDEVQRAVRPGPAANPLPYGEAVHS
jgi:CubicO group peptidase (beta-lactamase class C family)